MSVRIEPYIHKKKKIQTGWEVDIRYRTPEGQRLRERCKAPVTSKSGATRWAAERERWLLKNGVQRTTRKEVPTVEEFASRFLHGDAVADQQKPSTIASKDTILRVHLIPELGSKRLDAISSEDVQKLKQRLQQRSRKTVNNVLNVLSVLLKRAVEWDVIEQVPCSIRLLKPHRKAMTHWTFQEYAKLREAAEILNPTAHLIVLLGGDAGLRCGEMIGLEWNDVNFSNQQPQLCVQRSEWRGHVSAPKGGRHRFVPLTKRLETTLRESARQGDRVLCQPDGSPLTQDTVGDHVRRAAKRAGIEISGAHRLRHTFCSHLAMHGAPARAIQDAAGHQDLATTQRYMHLSTGAVDAAIRLLEQPAPF